jgi:hypothetical protein
MRIVNFNCEQEQKRRTSFFLFIFVDVKLVSVSSIFLASAPSSAKQQGENNTRQKSSDMSHVSDSSSVCSIGN